MQYISAAEVRPILNPEEHIVAVQPRTMQASADLWGEVCLVHVTIMVPRGRVPCPLEAAAYPADFEEGAKHREEQQSTEPLALGASLRRARSDV